MHTIFGITFILFDKFSKKSLSRYIGDSQNIISVVSFSFLYVQFHHTEINTPALGFLYSVIKTQNIKGVVPFLLQPLVTSSLRYKQSCVNLLPCLYYSAFYLIETLNHNCDRHGTQWYLVLIAVTVGIFLGMIVMYLMLRLRKRLDKKRNFSKSSNPGATQGNDSEYQELDLRQLSNKDNYQSLILGLQVPINLERQNERDPDYQGLSNVRENEDNYESLKL